MIRAALLCATLMVLVSAAQSPRSGDPDPGVPLAVAEDRSARISDLRYELHFVIPETQDERVEGRATIRFELKDASRPLVLDFVSSGMVAIRPINAGTKTAARLVNEHIVIPAVELREGANEISIEFLSSDAPLNRNPEFLYALFVPARARQAFPCFDQPDLKGRYTVSLEIPRSWEALTNGREISREDGGKRRLIRFAETEPIPTYLFTFAAGRFQVETAQRGARTFRMLHRETDAEKVARNRDAVFDLHAGALDWLEQYTGIPYPFGKFEFLLVPSFQFGGMEHPGAIFYNASALLLDPSATQNQKLGRASLIAHETAHMWFGDLVTMTWFNDVWMKEVFANFMAAKIVNPAFPEINHELRFLYAHYPTAYDVDRTAGTNPIRQRLDNLAQAGSLYGAIIYQKAPIVMRQLEMMLGPDGLRDGLRQYLRAHSFGNASWPDLIALLDERTPEDLQTWSRAWVEEAGRPVITTDLRTENGAVTSLELVQTDPLGARGLRWSQQLDVAVGYRRDVVGGTVKLDGPRQPVGIAGPGSAAPLFVLPAARGIGYGNFVLDAGSRSYLLANLPGLGHALMRGSALVVLWEEMVDGRVRPPDMLDMILRALPRERDELNVQRMLSYAQQVWWRWLPDEERRARVQSLEDLLRGGLDAAPTQSLKSAWFGALRDTALTQPALDWLERVWRRDVAVAGLELAEPDYITLAQELAVRGVPAAEKILGEQIDRTQNPDRKARMTFVRPALSADPGVREAFFGQLKDASNRRREAWVLEGIAYLHHPLRAAASEKYVQPSLELLRDIQQTGDIFFPKRWMDATLSGHRTPTVARTVRAFLDALPAGYPDRLRRIILSSADDLFRIQEGQR